MHLVSFRGDIKLIRFLLDHGADLNIQGEGYLKLCLVYAKELNDAKSGFSGGKYGTPLYAAAYTGNIKAVRLLLQKGADPNVGG